MKCNSCRENSENPIISRLRDSGYPIHNVCISEYFEKVGEVGMDMLCHTFNSVHFGYLMNLVHHSSDPRTSTDPTSAPPVVVWVNSNQEGNMFMLDDSTKQTIFTDLYDKLEQLPSEAYCMAVNSTMKQVANKDFLKHTGMDAKKFDNMSQKEKVDFLSENYKKDELETLEVGKDVVVMQGQAVNNRFGYKAIAEFGEHKGVRYLKPFKLIDDTDTLSYPNKDKEEEFKELKKKVKDVFNLDFFNGVQDKFKDKKDDDDTNYEGDNPFFDESNWSKD